MIAAVEVGEQRSAAMYARRVAADAVSTDTVDPSNIGPLTGTNLRELDMQQLGEMAADPEVQRNPRALNAVMGEVDLRASNRRPVDEWSKVVMSAAVAFHDPGPSAGSSPRGAARKAGLWADAAGRMDQMLVGNMDAKMRRTMRHLYGVADTSAAGRIPQMRADWKALCYDQMIQAKADCDGQLLTSKAVDAGATPFDLWTRTAQWVKANATEQFIQWRATHPRLTVHQYLATVSGALDGSAPRTRQRAGRK